MGQQKDITVNVEIVEKTEADWLWTVYEADGSLVDCGHETNPSQVKENVMLVVDKMITDQIKSLVSKPRLVK